MWTNRLVKRKLKTLERAINNLTRMAKVTPAVRRQTEPSTTSSLRSSPRRSFSCRHRTRLSREACWSSITSLSTWSENRSWSGQRTSSKASRRFPPTISSEWPSASRNSLIPGSRSASSATKDLSLVSSMRTRICVSLSRPSLNLKTLVSKSDQSKSRLAERLTM